MLFLSVTQGSIVGSILEYLCLIQVDPVQCKRGLTS